MTLEELKQITEEYFNIELTPKDRKAHNVRVRFLYYHTAYRMFPGMTLQDLADSLGQTHATVLNGIKELPFILKAENNFAKMCEGYYKMIKLDRHTKTDFNVVDYDELRTNKAMLVNLSAKMKIDQLKKQVKTQKLIIKKQQEKLEYFKEMTGI